MQMKSPSREGPRRRQQKPAYAAGIMGGEGWNTGSTTPKLAAPALARAAHSVGFGTFMVSFLGCIAFAISIMLQNGVP